MKENWIKQSSKLVFVLVCVALAEGILLTGGRLFSVGPLSFRMLLFAVMGLLCVPYLCKRFFPAIKNPFTISLILFAIVLAVGLLRAVQAGQEMFFAIYMIKGCLYLLWFPILLAAVRTRKQVECLLGIVIVGASILSLGTIAITLIAKYQNDWITPLYYALRDSNLGMLYMATEKLPRMLFMGVMAQIAACAFCAYFYLQYFSRRRCRYVAVALTALNLVGLLQTYTRGVYLGAGVALFCLALGMLSFKERRRLFTRFLLSGVGCFLVMVILIDCVLGFGIFSYGFFRISTGTPFEPVAQTMLEISMGERPFLPAETPAPPETPGTPGTPSDVTPAEPDPPSQMQESIAVDKERNEISHDIRAEMKSQLSALISQNPIFGNGLGAHIDLRDGLVEMVWHDMISKIGYLGLVVFLFPLGVILCCMFTQARKLRRTQASDTLYMLRVVLFSSTAAVIVSSYTNPYIFGVLGLFFYCFTMRACSIKDFPIEGMEDTL